MLSEAQKLDSIVRDYETILKSKRVMFRGEDMNEIIRGVIALVEGERRARNVRLELQLADNPVWFTANRQIMRVAVLHLLKNAIEATPSGGTVAIRTKVTQDNAVFSISDTGKGIGADDLQKIFSLFYSTKRHRLGMGLPLVKQIVEEHRGTISVESAPGEGTTFAITVPVRWTEEVLKERPNGEQEE
jgi:signal transduction histidine kinase